jgi:hypothetical protein
MWGGTNSKTYSTGVPLKPNLEKGLKTLIHGILKQ